MRRLVYLFVTVLGLLSITASPALAITGNFVPDNEHPFVGLAVFYDAKGAFLQRCSGSLLTPYVFLTAGHCVEGVSTSRVYFQQNAGANLDPNLGYDPITGYPLTCAPGTEALCSASDEIYNFGFPAGFPNQKDVGLIILDHAIVLPEYGALAAAGSLDRLATRRGTQEVTFTVSGYGLSRINPVQMVSFRSRLMAEEKIVNLRSALTGGFNLQTSANPGGGRGGTCFGDSGGPAFYGGFSSNNIVGVTSFGLNQNCRGVGFSYRTDQAAVISWILDTVGRSSQPQDAARIRIVQIS